MLAWIEWFVHVVFLFVCVCGVAGWMLSLVFCVDAVYLRMLRFADLCVGCSFVGFTFVVLTFCGC